MTEALTTLALQSPAVAVFAAALAGLCVALIIWSVLVAVQRNTPASRTADDATIEAQIASLQRRADHAMAQRPRLRGNGCSVPPVAHIKAAPHKGHVLPRAVPDPKPCGGGMCRKSTICKDHACPGKVDAALRANSR